MKYSAVTLSLLLILAAMPLAAQDRTADLTLWASRTDVQGTTTLNDAFETKFEEGEGFGISLNVSMNRWLSAEVAAFRVSSDTSLQFEDLAFSMGSAGMSPLTAGVQFHPVGSSRFDPYLGAGAAYVVGGNLESEDLDNLGVGTIKLGNEFTYYANAGLGVRLFRGIGIALDARYIPYEPSGRSTVTDTEEDLDLTTILYSAGVRFRF